MRRLSRSLLRVVGASAFTLAVAAALDANAAQNGCRCATTFQGSGPSRVVVCEGFNPQDHQRCECEQIQVNQQTGCRPLDTAGPPERNRTPRPGRNG